MCTRVAIDIRMTKSNRDLRTNGRMAQGLSGLYFKTFFFFSLHTRLLPSWAIQTLKSRLSAMPGNRRRGWKDKKYSSIYSTRGNIVQVDERGVGT